MGGIIRGLNCVYIDDILIAKQNMKNQRTSFNSFSSLKYRPLREDRSHHQFPYVQRHTKSMHNFCCNRFLPETFQRYLNSSCSTPAVFWKHIQITFNHWYHWYCYVIFIPSFKRPSLQMLSVLQSNNQQIIEFHQRFLLSHCHH